MKQQSISFLIDSKGNKKDFERWQYKKASTVLENLRELYGNYSKIYGISSDDRVDIYSTPDGVHEAALIYSGLVSDFTV